MVRFKNRYLIIEFLQPSTSTPQLFDHQQSQGAGPSKPLYPEGDLADEDEDEDEEDDDELVGLARIPDIPFLLPPIPDPSSLKDGEEGGKAIYRAVRDMVQDVFGDEGWGRVSSSFRVVYHSPLTTITLVRIARPHIRTLHAAITLLSSIEGKAVLPRVIGVSGTVKKAQGRIGIHHRTMIAQVLARLDQDASRYREKDELERCAEKEQLGIKALDD